MLTKAKKLIKQFRTMEDDDFKTEIWNNPQIVLAMLDLILKEYKVKKVLPETDENYVDCMDTFEQALTEIRYSTDRNRQWAVDIAEKIQLAIAEKALIVEVDAGLQHDLMKALYISGLKLRSEIKEQSSKVAEYYGRFTTRGQSIDTEQLFKRITKGARNNPTHLYDNLMSQLNLLTPEEQLAFIAEMIKSNNPLIHELSVVLLLHPDRDVRCRIPALFDILADLKTFKPRDLRRMIGIRNWLPEEERPGVDSLIQKLRRAKIQCASMPAAKNKQIYISPFDGSGSQAVWIFVKKMNKYESTNILFRQAQGIHEIWGEKKLKKGDVKLTIDRIKNQAMSSKTKKSYLDAMTSHFIQKGLEHGNPPPPLLIYSAETLGHNYWIPKSIDIDDELTMLESSMEPEELLPEAIDKVLETSKSWHTDKNFAVSWFEDDATVDELLKDSIDSVLTNNDRMIESMALVLHKIIEKKRTVWAERILFMALWAKSGNDQYTQLWKEFFILARELNRGTPLHEIPLMASIAMQSILAAIKRKNNTANL